MTRRDRRRTQRLLARAVIALTLTTAAAPAVVSLENHGWVAWVAMPSNND